VIAAALGTPLMLDPLQDEPPCPALASQEKLPEPDQRGTRLDAAFEHLALSPATLVIKGQTYGAWKRRGAILAPPPKTYAALIAPTPRVDLLLRARLSTDRSLDAWLASRAAFDPQGAQISGYQLRFTGERAQLWRVDGPEQAAPISPSEPVFQLNKRRAIEVLWWSLGPTHLVQIHDAGSGVELLSLLAHDPTYTRGATAAGFPDAHPNRPNTGLLSLSSRDACAPRGQDLATPQPRRFFSFPTETFDALPAPLASRLEVLERSTDKVVAQGGATLLEDLHCARYTPASSSIEIPWRYIERDHLAWRRSPPVRDAAGGLRADLASFTPEQVAASLASSRHLRPDLVQLTTLGHSHRGQPLLAARVGRGLPPPDKLAPGRPVVFMLASHHGSEPASTSILMDQLAQLLQRAGHDPRADRWLDRLDLWIIPMVNPDGTHDFLNLSSRTGRKNGRVTSTDPLHALRQGVDLNRNYPLGWGIHGEKRTTSGRTTSAYYRGPKPASEPETQAIMALTERLRPVAALTYHTGTVSILVPYTDGKTHSPQPNEAQHVANLLAQAAPPHPDGLPWRVRSSLYPVDGTDQDWMRHSFGTVALLIEAARRTPRTRCERQALHTANRPVWEALLDLTAAGPLALITVTNAAGAPLPDVMIQLKDQALRAQERWTTRADGLHARLLISPGPHTVLITHNGRTSQHLITVAPDRPTPITLVAP
jgi:hypothetical protein